MAVAYFRAFVAPKKRYRLADDVESATLVALSSKLADLPEGASAEEIQHALYDLARPIERYQDLNAKGATPERPGVIERLVQYDLSGAAGRRARAEAGLVHRALRSRGDAGVDRKGVGGRLGWGDSVRAA